MLNGDGLRVVLWVSGCSHCCKECQNPITWDPNGGLLFDEEAKQEIYSDMTVAGLPNPEYVETPNTVKLILKNNIDERTAHRNKSSGNGLSGGLNGGLNGGLSGGLNADEILLLNTLTGALDVTQKQLAEKTGFSLRKVERLMKDLREKGIVQRRGSKKKGTWEITK